MSTEPSRGDLSSRVSVSGLFTPSVLTPEPPHALEPAKALDLYTKGVYASHKINVHLPRPLTDVTLSGSQMSGDGAWLEVGGNGVRVYGDTGEIHWFKEPVPSAGAWMIVWLGGLQPGATYLGQIRCFASEIVNRQYHIAMKVVHPGHFEMSYIPVTQASFVIPFAFISVSAQAGITPNVQFFPEYLSHCLVYDVHVKKV